MLRIEMAPEITEDIDRILNHLVSNSVAEAAERIQEIIQAIDVLVHNPESRTASKRPRNVSLAMPTVD